MNLQKTTKHADFLKYDTLSVYVKMHSSWHKNNLKILGWTLQCNVSERLLKKIKHITCLQAALTAAGLSKHIAAIMNNKC